MFWNCVNSWAEFSTKLNWTSCPSVKKSQFAIAGSRKSMRYKRHGLASLPLATHVRTSAAEQLYLIIKARLSAGSRDVRAAWLFCFASRSLPMQWVSQSVSYNVFLAAALSWCPTRLGSVSPAGLPRTKPELLALPAVLLLHYRFTGRYSYLYSI